MKEGSTTESNLTTSIAFIYKWLRMIFLMKSWNFIWKFYLSDSLITFLKMLWMDPLCKCIVHFCCGEEKNKAKIPYRLDLLTEPIEKDWETRRG